MRNQYGQTDILARYLAQQPQQHHTALGTALRLGGAGIAALGDYKRREGQQTALVDALRGLNTPGANGPTMAAAASAPVQDPEGMAALLSNPASAPIAQSLLAKALAGPEKGELVKAADGYLYNSVTGQRAFPDVVALQSPTLKSVHGVGLVDVSDPANPRVVQAEGQRPPSTSVNVNTGNPNALPGLSKLPAGFTYRYDGQGNVMRDAQGLPMVAPIPGTKQAADVDAEAAKADKREQQERQQADIMLQDIDRALDLVENSTFPTTGFAGNIMQHVAGTSAGDLRATLATIKGNIAFDKINAMRQASPTGGALGGVSNNELAMLSAAFGSLEQSQSEEQFVKNLRRLRSIYNEVVHGSAPVTSDDDGWKVERVN